MNEHTKEPWRHLNDAGKFMQADQWDISYEGRCPVASSAFIFAEDMPVAAVLEEADSYQSDAPLLRANARRIVACVNACAGIPTEMLEKRTDMGAAEVSRLMQLEQQRNKLLAALKESLPYISEDREYNNAAAVIAMLEAAPPQPRLSDERIKELSDMHMNMYGFDDVAFARAIEREILGVEQEQSK